MHASIALLEKLRKLFPDSCAQEEAILQQFIAAVENLSTASNLNGIAPIVIWDVLQFPLERTGNLPG